MIWKQSEEFPRYEVSNTGSVRNIKTGRILKMYKTPAGYVRVGLCSPDGRRRVIRVHRLVASTFIENHDKAPHVDHINRVRDDNNVDNLRWVDPIGNSNNRGINTRVIEHIIHLHNNGMSSSQIQKALDR